MAIARATRTVQATPASIRSDRPAIGGFTRGSRGDRTAIASPRCYGRGMAEPFDLSRYLRLRAGVEEWVREHYPGELESLPEPFVRAYLKEETDRMWGALQDAHRRYAERIAGRA